MEPLPPLPPHIPEFVQVPDTIPALEGHSRALTLPRPAVARFRKANAWLNDDCINIGAQLILRHIGVSAARGDPAIFSTFLLPSEKKGDEGLWRVSKSVEEYWKKDLWIFPLHRNGNHWVLAVVYWKKRRIAYFDSFGSKSSFKSDVPVCFLCPGTAEALTSCLLDCFFFHSSPPTYCGGAWERNAQYGRRLEGISPRGAFACCPYLLTPS